MNLRALGQIVLCSYNIVNNDADKYGLIYKWNSAASGMSCPTGWLVPTDNDFKQLETFLGMPLVQVEDVGFGGSNQGIQMKSATDWLNGEIGTNSSGFSGLPGGRIKITAVLELVGSNGFWWTSSDYSVIAPFEYRGWARGLSYAFTGVWRGVPLIDEGQSVRCIKD